MRTLGIIVLVLLVAFAAIYFGLRWKGHQSGSGAPTQVAPVVYDMVSNSLLLMREKESFDDDAKPMGESGRARIKAWLTTCDFQRFSSTEEADLENCRTMMLTIIASDKDGFARGYKGAELMNEGMLPLLIDFEIDGDKATREGRPELSEAVNGTLDFVKALLLMRCEESKTAEVRPAARLMVEYLAISNQMVGRDDRPDWAQGALLTMHPEKLEDPAERLAYTTLQEDLMEYSRAVTKGNDPDVDMKQSRFIVDLATAADVAKITDQQMIDAGGSGYVSTLHSMRKLME